MTLLRCGFCLALVTIATTSLARTWELYPDGSGDAPSLGAAVDSAGNGDTIVLADGEYRGRVDYEGKNLIFRGLADGARNAIIRESFFRVRNCESVEVRDVVIEDSENLLIAGVGTVSIFNVAYVRGRQMWSVHQCESVEIVGCEIRERRETEYLSTGGLEVYRPGTVLVKECHFVENVGLAGEEWDLSGSGGGGLCIDSDANPVVVQRNLFLRNEAPSGAAAYLSGAVTFTDNTVVGNSGRTGAVVINELGPSVAHSNVFAHNDQYGLWNGEWGGLGLRAWCNLFWENDGTPHRLGDPRGWWGYPAGYKDWFDWYPVVESPGFCDPDADDFRLMKSSPAIPANRQDTFCADTLGVFPVGCFNPTRQTSWGELKSLLGGGR